MLHGWLWRKWLRIILLDRWYLLNDPLDTVPGGNQFSLRSGLPSGCVCLSSDYKMSNVADSGSWWGSQIRRETPKTTRIEITSTMSTRHGFKHLAIFLHFSPSLERMILLHKITHQTDHLWAPCNKGLSTITHIMCVSHLLLCSEWCSSMHRAARFRNRVCSYLHAMPRKLSLFLAITSKPVSWTWWQQFSISLLLF